MVGIRKAIWIGIRPASWRGIDTKERWPRKKYIVEKVTDAVKKAKADDYFKPYFRKMKNANVKKMSFVWSYKERVIHRNSTTSFFLSEVI